MSLIVKLGKKGKKIVKKFAAPAEKHHLSYTRRIERIKTGRRICAMTFDDGPMDLPAAPDRFGGKSLTDVLLDTLAEFGAKGTFDVVGDTGENYPDKAGKAGSAGERARAGGLAALAGAARGPRRQDQHRRADQSQAVRARRGGGRRAGHPV